MTERMAAIVERADHHFFPEAFLQESDQDLVRLRMGLLLCLTAGLGGLLFVLMQSTSWPAIGALAVSVCLVTALVLPFALRKRPAIRLVGPIGCGILSIVSALALFTSGGQSIGILAFLPMLPITGLLVGGRRGALAWGGVAALIAAVGFSLATLGLPPASGYAESSPADRYAIASLCILGMAGIAQILESFRGRAVIEVADRARAELRKREEHNRNLLEHATEGVMIVDSKAVIRFANAAAERLVGVDPGEALGHRLRDFTMPEDFLRTWPMWQEVLSTADSVGRLQLRTRPGRGIGDPADARFLDITVANRLHNPAVAGIIVRMRDSTELARAEANYEALVEHAIQGIAVTCGGELVYANQALADLFGVERDELLSVSNEEGLRMVHEADRPRLRSDQPVHGLAQPRSAEVRFRRGRADWRWIRLRWASASWEGRPARQIAFADVTAERELAARQEREHERLEAAIAERTRELEASQRSLRQQERMAAVGTLAAGIAHQINNPIGAILTSADFAILVADEQDAEQVRAEALEEIRGQAIRCGKIVRSVLQFSRAEATEKWAADVTGVLRTALDVTARYAAERQARTEVDISPAAARQMAIINPIEIEQVFVNLIRNAIESKPEAVHVRVNARLIDDEIEVSIEDDGSGIAPAHASHVFEPFYTTRLREGGTGLGLSVAHGIIEDHGGRMWLEAPLSDEAEGQPSAQGARFVLRLPTEKTPTRA